MMVDKKEYRAIVEKVIPDGKHGPYAVVYSKELGSVTFSLGNDVWDGEECPEPGTYVMLSKLRKKRAGWRAQHARFEEPGDEQPPAVPPSERSTSNE